MEYSIFKPKSVYTDKPLIYIDTMNKLSEIQHKITKEPPIPNKIISPWIVTNQQFVTTTRETVNCG